MFNMYLWCCLRLVLVGSQVAVLARLINAQWYSGSTELSQFQVTCKCCTVHKACFAPYHPTTAIGGKGA